MSTTTGVVIGLGLVLFALVAFFRGRGRSKDLGTVSSTWLIENKMDHHDRN